MPGNENSREIFHKWSNEKQAQKKRELKHWVRKIESVVMLVSSYRILFHRKDFEIAQSTQILTLIRQVSLLQG